MIKRNIADFGVVRAVWDGDKYCETETTYIAGNDKVSGLDFTDEALAVQ